MWWWWWASAALASICTPDGATCWGSIGEAMTTTTGPLSLVLTAGDYVEPTVLVPPGRQLEVGASGVVVLSSVAGSLFQVAGGLTLHDLTLAAPNDAVIRAIGGVVEVRSSVLLTLGLVGDGGILYQQGGSLTIADSTLLDGLSFGDGGQVYARDATVILQRSTFTGGFARSGGAVAFEATTDMNVTIGDCRFEKSTAVADGGAISMVGPVHLTVTESRFEDNRASRGGGVAVGADADATLVIRSSTFENDEGTQSGGAVHASSGAVTISSSTFVANRAPSGGAIAASGEASSTSLVQNLLCRNEAEQGGALWFGQGEHTVTNNRVLRNSASAFGGALHVSGGTVDLRFNDLLSNRATRGSVMSLVSGLEPESSAIMRYDLVAWNSDASVFDGTGIDEERNLFYGNSGLAVGLHASDLRVDPLLTAYVPSADCDAIVTNYSYYGPMRDPFADEVPLPTDTDRDGSLADIGSYGGPDSDPRAWQDSDGDGVPSLLDCDDDNAAIRPNISHSNEIWYDGIDQDCDGRDTDEDGDGVELPLDCDDQDPTRFPGAVELVGMGDMDCDGFADADHDGYSPPEDCADDDPRIHPGAAEDADPLLDRDCDGIGDPIGPLVRRGCADGRAGVGWLGLIGLAATRRSRQRRK